MSDQALSDRSRRLRALALAALLLAAAAPTCTAPPARLAPAAGAPDYQRLALVEVPMAQVNAAGGNLLVRRPDLDIDTRLGRNALGAVYNSATGRWRWSFELHYDGARFVDGSGAVHRTAGLEPGAAIPGSTWVMLDASRIATKGGLVHSFAANGGLASVHWRGSDYPRLRFVSSGVAGAERIVAIEQELDPDTRLPVFEILRDADGRVVRVGDRAGRVAEFAYDPVGRLIEARDGLDVEQGWPGFRYAYEGSLLTALVNSEGERTEIQYEDRRVVRVRAVGEEGAEYVFVHGRRDAEGLYATSVRDPLGNETRLRSDARRRLRERVDPTGARTRFSWSGLRPVSRTDPAGLITRWRIAGDDVVEEMLPGGNVRVFAWAEQATNRFHPRRRPLQSFADSLGLLEERVYDARGRLVELRNGAGERTMLHYGALDEIITLTLPNGLSRSFSDYGEHGHPTRITDGEVEREQVFDAVGNLLRGPGRGGPADPGRPGVVSRRFDADRNPSELLVQEIVVGHPFLQDRVELEYRSDGRPRRIGRPHGGDVELLYDALGRLTERRERVDGAWRSTRFERDALGRALRQLRPNGTWTETGFDAAGRRSRLASGRGEQTESEADFVYVDGRLVAIVDPERAGPETYAYDEAGRVAAIDFPEGESLELGYDLRSRVVAEHYRLPGGALLRSLAFAHDAAGREVRLLDGAATLLEREFQAGRLTRTRYGNGLERSVLYDPEDGLQIGTSLVDAAGSVVAATTVERGRSYLPIAHFDHWNAVTVTTGEVAVRSEESHLLAPAWRADRQHPGARLGAWAAQLGEPQPHFLAYDALGNLSDTPGLSAFVYNAERNRLLEIRDGEGELLHHYVHDEAGFVIERDGLPIAWTADGRLAAYGELLRVRWDVLGRCVESETGGQLTRMRFGGRVLADAAGTPVAMDRGELRIDLLAGEHRYRHFDFRGNVKLVSDASGAIRTHRRFGPYGVDAVFGVDDGGPGFARGRSVGELVWIGGRLLDPAAARFLAPDPVFQLVNDFVYAEGDPIGFWDPDGRSAQSALVVAAGVAVVGMAAGAVLASSPALFGAGLALTLSSSGLLSGLLVPATATGGLGASAVAGQLTRMGLPFSTIAPLFGGFTVGQGLQFALATDFAAQVPRASPPAPARGVRKIQLELELVAVSPGSVAGAGASVGGCGSSPLGLDGVPRLHWALALLVPLQLGLALALARRR